MSKKEDNDKVTMSQCEKKSMVIQGIKDRSKIRRYKVTERQGSGDEGEAKVKGRKTRKDPEMGVRETKGRSREDPGKIHRSKGFGVQGCRREYRKRDKEGRCWRREQGVGIWARGGLGGGRGEDGTRTIECGGVLGSLVRSDEGRSEERGEKKT